MITLTPEEAAAYDRDGMIGAIRLFRYRTNLGLAQSKRCIELWADHGRPVTPDGRATDDPNCDSRLLEKLSESETLRMRAEQTIHDQRRKAVEIAYRIMRDAESEIWKRACGAIADALGKELHD